MGYSNCSKGLFIIRGKSQNLNTTQYPIYISVQILTVDYNQNLTTFSPVLYGAEQDYEC